MKLLLTIIDWEYPEDREPIKPELYDLSANNADEVMSLYLLFANGVIIELKADGDSEDAIQLIRGLALGAGSCKQLDSLPVEVKERLWLYTDGYECYQQGQGESAAYIFINSIPSLEKF